MGPEEARTSKGHSLARPACLIGCALWTPRPTPQIRKVLHPKGPETEVGGRAVCLSVFEGTHRRLAFHTTMCPHQTMTGLWQGVSRPNFTHGFWKTD